MSVMQNMQREIIITDYDASSTQITYKPIYTFICLNH